MAFAVEGHWDLVVTADTAAGGSTRRRRMRWASSSISGLWPALPRAGQDAPGGAPAPRIGKRPPWLEGRLRVGPGPSALSVRRSRWAESLLGGGPGRLAELHVADGPSPGSVGHDERHCLIRDDCPSWIRSDELRPAVRGWGRAVGVEVDRARGVRDHARTSGGTLLTIPASCYFLRPPE